MTDDKTGKLATELYAYIASLNKALAKTRREAQKVNMELAMNGSGADRLAFLIDTQDRLEVQIAEARKRLAAIGY